MIRSTVRRSQPPPRIVAATAQPRIYHATVTIAQIMTEAEEPEASDLFQFDVEHGQSLKRESRKYFRSRDVSDVRIGLTPSSSREVWISEVRFGEDVVFRGYARRVHIDAELRPDERISVVVIHAEVVP
jgi:hypothetical protein